MALADYQQLVDSMVRDQSGTITPLDRDRAIELARLRYSQDARRELVEDVTWTALGVFGPAPMGWTPFATVLRAEYPIGQQPLAEIHAAVYEAPGGLGLETVNALPPGAVVRLTITAPHVLRDQPAADTIPLVHREAVASYAAHLLCKQLASYFSGQRETAIGADVSQTDTRARQYASQAKDYRRAYYASLGLVDPYSDKAGAVAGSGVASAASVGQWPGRGRYGLTRGVL
ncbi:hypothetical protein ACFX58_03485 [Sphingomonas sp. NCPPB 2930]